ncbi:hypothetical protein SBA2_780006 [Acidobacteriia bacterium SbA2]|nr:hypothetical protein SBA2_780006 [Acidobacteriia bacterium SbA2]
MCLCHLILTPLIDIQRSYSKSGGSFRPFKARAPVVNFNTTSYSQENKGITGRRSFWHKTCPLKVSTCSWGLQS